MSIDELSEYVKQIALRRQVLRRSFIVVINKTEEFAEKAIEAIGEVSVDECKEAIKRVFCEEMDKLK